MSSHAEVGFFGGGQGGSGLKGDAASNSDCAGQVNWKSGGVCPEENSGTNGPEGRARPRFAQADLARWGMK